MEGELGYNILWFEDIYLFQILTYVFQGVFIIDN